jgi:hypothetical protein
MVDLGALFLDYLIPFLGILILIGCVIAISWLLRRFRTFNRDTYDDYARRIIAGLAGGTVVYLAQQFKILGQSDWITAIATGLVIILFALAILYLGALLHFGLALSPAPSTNRSRNNYHRWDYRSLGIIVLLIAIIILLIYSLTNNNIGWVWTALSAIGTLGLALLVVYKDILSRPIIDIEFEQEEPFCRQGLSPTGSAPGPGLPTPTTNGYWIRIRVINHGRTAANKCEGRLVEIRLPNGQLFQPFDPVVLHWVGRNDFNRININSHDFEYLDVLYTLNGNPDTIINCPESRPLGALPPRGIRTVLPAGNYRIRLSISSENARPITRDYLVDWNGTWNQIAIREA